MKITIELNTDNAAFENNLDNEVKRILNDALNAFNLDYLLASENTVNLEDINGNNVGKMEVTE